MREIILNKCYGGFDVSYEAYKLYAHKKGLDLYRYKSSFKDIKHIIYNKAKDDEDLFVSYFTKDFGDNVEISNEDYEKYLLNIREDKREDPILIEVIKELGEKASGRFGNLKIVKIPNDADFVLEEYDGIETLYYSKSKIYCK